MHSHILAQEAIALAGLPDLEQFRDDPAADASPLPIQSRAVNWIFVTGEPGFWYWGEFVAVNEAWIDAVMAAHVKLQAGGYEAPVLAEHDPYATDGRRLGDIVELAKYETPSGVAMAALVRWTAGSEAPADIESGAIRYFSPGIGIVEHGDTGEELYTVAELSVTTAPQQKGTATHVLASQRRYIMATEENTTLDELKAQLEEFRAAVAAKDAEAAELRAQLDELRAQLADDAPDAPDADPEEEEEEEGTAAAEIRTMRAELAELREQRDRATFRSGFPVGETIVICAENRDYMEDLLFEAWRTDVDTFVAQVAAHTCASEVAQTPAGPTPPVDLSESPWLRPIGSTGARETSSTDDAEAWKQSKTEATDAAGKLNVRRAKEIYRAKVGA